MQRVDTSGVLAAASPPQPLARQADSLVTGDGLVMATLPCAPLPPQHQDQDQDHVQQQTAWLNSLVQRSASPRTRELSQSVCCWTWSWSWCCGGGGVHGRVAITRPSPVTRLSACLASGCGGEAAASTPDVSTRCMPLHSLSVWLAPAAAALDAAPAAADAWVLPAASCPLHNHAVRCTSNGFVLQPPYCLPLRLLRHLPDAPSAVGACCIVCASPFS